MSMPKKQAECHPDRPHLAKGLCKTCYDQKYQKDNNKTVNARKRKWAKENPDRIRAQRLRHRYGIEQDRYQAILNAQDGLCKICNEASATDVDHNHETGEVRGILCGDCNRALGLFKEKPEALERAIMYLELFEKRVL